MDTKIAPGGNGWLIFRTENHPDSPVTPEVVETWGTREGCIVSDIRRLERDEVIAGELITIRDDQEIWVCQIVASEGIE